MVAHLDAVTSLAVDPNGLYLLSGSKILYSWHIFSSFLSGLATSTTPKAFWKAVLLLWLGLPLLIRHENGVFGKTLFRNLKTPAFRLREHGNDFGSCAFRKRCRFDNHVISLTEFFSNTNPKWTVIIAFLTFPLYSGRKTFDSFSRVKSSFWNLSDLSSPWKPLGAGENPRTNRSGPGSAEGQTARG